MDPREDPEGYEPDDPAVAAIRDRLPADARCEVCKQGGELLTLSDHNLAGRLCHAGECQETLQRQLDQDGCLIHGIFPFPEHCGKQMRLLGNASLHALTYQCQRCYINLEVQATFAFYRRIERPVPPAILDALDQVS